MGNLLLWLFYFFTFYAFLPGLLSRLFGFRVFKRGISDTDIALTFDDGPDPIYTPMLLDVLLKHGVKGTFFIVGKHAEQHPDLLRRMYKEGHAIGIHNYVHRSNWIMRPRTVEKHVSKTSDIIEGITGEKPQFYRPPWGILNVFDFSKKHDMHIVLWSMMAKDWRKSDKADNIKKRLLKSLRGGHIYLLHDCGRTFGADPNAPRETIQALKEFIPEALRRGYEFVRVDELMQVTGRMAKKRESFWRKIMVSLWLFWERCFHAMFRLQSATGDEKRSFLYYRLTRYRGETIQLDDHSALRTGDPIVELHMNNALLYEFGRKARSPVQLAIQLIRAMERTMPELARHVLNRHDAASIKAILGTTMVNRGVEQFGFKVADLPRNSFSWFTRIYLKLLLSIIHPQGKDRLGERAELLIPKRIALSIQELAIRYGSAEEENNQQERVDARAAADGQLA